MHIFLKRAISTEICNAKNNWELRKIFQVKAMFAYSGRQLIFKVILGKKRFSYSPLCSASTTICYCLNWYPLLTFKKGLKTLQPPKKPKPKKPPSVNAKQEICAFIRSNLSLRFIFFIFL